MNAQFHERTRSTSPARTASTGGDAVVPRRRQISDTRTSPGRARHAADDTDSGCLQGAGESKYVAAPAEGRPVSDPLTRSGPACGDATAPDLLTLAQVMARLQVGRHTVYDLIRTRRLRSVLIGRCRRVPVVALCEFLDSLTGGE
jgi:excisionase family DNA binding protein